MSLQRTELHFATFNGLALRAEHRVGSNSHLFHRRRAVLDTRLAETSLIAARITALYNRPDRTVRE